MALKTVFDLIDKIYGKLIDDAFGEAEKMGAEGTKALYYMMTTTGLVLFDIKDRKVLDDSLVKIAGDILQGFLLNAIIKNGKTAAAIDAELIDQGNSLGDLLLALKHAKPYEQLTDAQRIELATMITAGSQQPWLYGQNIPKVGDPLYDLYKATRDWWKHELGDISDTVNSLWQQARNWIARRDPLVLDLDGDGIETVGISATTHILFDYNNDGIKTGTGWIAGEDAFYFSRHPELVSGSQSADHVRNDGDAVNNFNFKNERGVG
jgi:hypothetical protein